MSSNQNGHKITPQQAKHVTKLARLALDDRELPKLASQLESILEYVAQIDQVDVSNVPPLTHAASVKNVLREDIPEPALPIDQVLQNAAQTDGHFFMVPKVVGGDEDSAG